MGCRQECKAIAYSSLMVSRKLTWRPEVLKKETFKGHVEMTLLCHTSLGMTEEVLCLLRRLEWMF